MRSRFYQLGDADGRRRVIRFAGIATFGLWGIVWAAAMLLGFTRRFDAWLYDFNVYHAGAVDLLDRTLYRAPLIESGHLLPTAAFNYPPLAAAWVAPLLPLGREPGGIVWLAICGLTIGLAGVLAARSLGIAAVWVGMALLAYSRYDLFLADVLLANNNHLVLGLMAGFVWAHLAGHQRLAGVLLALAIGTKVWPVALLVLVLRERRWPELRWTLGVLAIQGIVTLAWLGPDVIGPMWAAVVEDNAPRAGIEVRLLWTSWARVALDWWPAWGGYAVAGLLLLIPVRGRLGLGLGIMAGLALNTNLWHHYLLVVMLGLVLIAAGLLVRCQRPEAVRLDARRGGRLRGVAQDQVPSVGAVAQDALDDGDRVGQART